MAVMVYARFLPADNLGVKFCLGLQLGGAIGNNLIDRVQLGHVTDFLLFTLPVGAAFTCGRRGMWRTLAIVVGTIGLVILLLRAESKKVEPQARHEETQNDRRRTSFTIAQPQYSGCRW